MNRIVFPIVLFLLLTAICPYANAEPEALDKMAAGGSSDDEISNFSDNLYVSPNGEEISVKEILPDNSVVTDEGVIISPDGAILSGPYKGRKIVPLLSDDLSPEIARIPAGAEIPDLELPDIGGEEKSETPLSVASFLPTTGVPEKSPKKSKGKAGREAGQAGKNLYIPPEAARGNMEFLEGCWQGIRPNWKEKRDIAECFCFNKSGGGGVRQIRDPKYGRCRGSSRGSVSGAGTLSLKNGMARCSGNVAYAPVTVICKNKGKRAECVWKYSRKDWHRDEQKEIPFTRVNSCR